MDSCKTEWLTPILVQHLPTHCEAQGYTTACTALLWPSLHSGLAEEKAHRDTELLRWRWEVASLDQSFWLNTSVQSWKTSVHYSWSSACNIAKNRLKEVRMGYSLLYRIYGACSAMSRWAIVLQKLNRKKLKVLHLSKK